MEILEYIIAIPHINNIVSLQLPGYDWHSWTPTDYLGLYSQQLKYGMYVKCIVIFLWNINKMGHKNKSFIFPNRKLFRYYNKN